MEGYSPKFRVVQAIIHNPKSVAICRILFLLLCSSAFTIAHMQLQHKKSCMII